MFSSVRLRPLSYIGSALTRTVQPVHHQSSSNSTQKHASIDVMELSKSQKITGMIKTPMPSVSGRHHDDR